MINRVVMNGLFSLMMSLFYMNLLWRLQMILSLSSSRSFLENKEFIWDLALEMSSLLAFQCWWSSLLLLLLLLLLESLRSSQLWDSEKAVSTCSCISQHLNLAEGYGTVPWVFKALQCELSSKDARVFLCLLGEFWMACELNSVDARVFLCLLGEFWMAWAANSRTTLALNLNKAPKASLCWLQIICPRIYKQILSRTHFCRYMPSK